MEQGSSGAAVKVLQSALGIDADGSFGPATAKALLEFTTDNPLLTANEETTALLWHVLEQADYPTLPYRATTVADGDQGPAVTTAQDLIGVEADGVFGPNTEKAVRAAQAEAGIDVTGLVDGPTWAALDRGAPEVVEKTSDGDEAADDMAGEKDARGGKVDASIVRD